ncbi:hypothetical protein [Shimia sp.]|uniref:hypothetical protein n=1 Tax=Shimia sp. TaxID=1954381 RepID=UPI003B8C6D51
MKTLEKVGRFSVCSDKGKFYIRWWERHARKTKSRLLAASTKTEAVSQAKELAREFMEPNETISVFSGLDPTFGEVWIAFEQEKRRRLSSERFRLLRHRLDLYYRPFLFDVRMSAFGHALIEFVRHLETLRYSKKRGHIEPGRGDKIHALHPNTIADIVGSALEVCSNAYSSGYSNVPPPKKPFIAGVTAPHNRQPKGGILLLKRLERCLKRVVDPMFET